MRLSPLLLYAVDNATDVPGGLNHGARYVLAKAG
jgi:hypothetical protein